MEERVLVVRRSDLFRNRPEFHGFCPASDYNFIDDISGNLFFKERSLVETDHSLKQIIPYNVFVSNGSVFVMQRLSSQTEKRLHNKYSVGIGGHINTEDSGDVIEVGRRREFDEEVSYDKPHGVKLVGFINDEGSDVGKVHFGVVYMVEGSDSSIEVREKDKMTGSMVPIEELSRYYDGMEQWSKSVVDYLRGS